MSEPRVRDHLKKEDIWTIPNIISMFRIALIPFILWVYCGVQNYTVAMILINRRFNFLEGGTKFVMEAIEQGSTERIA